MRLRFALPALGACAVASLLLAVPALATPSVQKPPTAVVKKLLTAQYTQESKEYASVKESYTPGTILNGTPRIGTHWADGTPPNTKTIVYPVKVTAVYWKCYASGDVRRQTIVGEYVFFQDDFREWTFRIKDESRTPSPGSDRVTGACPIQ
jgi:hypothetical protein